MSKLGRAVTQLGQRRVPVSTDPYRLTTITKEWNPIGPTVAQEFRIGVHLEARAQLTEQPAHSFNTVSAYRDIEQQVTDAILEEVFGEFRPHFRAVYLALMQQDIAGARRALATFEQLMFSAD